MCVLQVGIHTHMPYMYIHTCPTCTCALCVLQVASQKEQRVAQLGRMAARRLGHRDLSRGWTAWCDLAAAGRYQRSMLRSVASRLAKPRLSRAYVHWRQGWDRMEAATAAKAQVEKIRGQQASHDDTEFELQRQVSTLEDLRVRVRVRVRVGVRVRVRVRVR